MRQSLAKGQRRDLRRAMGMGALETIQQQDQAVAILSNALTNCQREIATLAINLAETKKHLTAVTDNLGAGVLARHVAITALDERVAAIEDTFMRRLVGFFAGK